MITSNGDTKEIFDVAREFGWKNFTDEQLQTLLYALIHYMRMRAL